MPDFIEEVLSSTKDFEAPRRFYYWAALSTVSAVMKDTIWFDMAGNYNIYPNIYVLLFGPSGIRKGPPIALAEDLVSRVDNTRVIDGRSSIEGVIKELGLARQRKDKTLITDSCGFMVASELSSSIIGNSSSMDIMTNLYDRNLNEKDWQYRLKVGESVGLKKPTITWLAGTNEALFKDFIPEKNINGGLIGRTFIISEYQKSRTNSLMFKTVAPNKDLLVKQLIAMTVSCKGEIQTTTEVRMAIDAWYNKFDKDIAPTLKDDTGFVSRVLDFIVKTGMIIAIGRRQSTQLTMSDITEATEQILPLVVPTKRVVNSLKKNDNAQITKRSLILTFLSNMPDFKCEKGKLLQSMGLQIDHEDLDRIAAYMISMGVLSIDNHAGIMTYRLRTDRPEVAKWIEQYRTGAKAT
jgi:hypothetical protein